MPKNNLIIAIVVIAVIGAGALWYFQGQKMSPQGNVVTSIKDALSKSVSLECNYTDQEGRASKTFIKNGAVRSDYTGKTDQETGSIIVVNKKLYMWTADKKGFMMEVPDVTGTPNEPSNQGLSQRDNMMSDLEKYKNDCKAAVVSDSLFTPPSDVDFQDFSKMMQAPAGGAGSGINQEQIQQYMQQGQDQTQPDSGQ